jgi:hypothetical protein
MSLFSASFAAGAAAVALVAAGSVAHAAPLGPPGSSCGPNMVVTDDHSCQVFNHPCTGYDMMVIGRVDHEGHCVVPGLNGTTW